MADKKISALTEGTAIASGDMFVYNDGATTKKIDADNLTVYNKAEINYNASATSNLGIGSTAMDSVTTGDYNVGLGDNAGTAITTGNYNTHIGHNAGTGQSTADSNTFIGYDTGALSSGPANTAVGYQALRGNVADTRNVAIGHQAGSTATATDCIYIGYQAGQANTIDDILYIDNTATLSPLLFGDMANRRVVINGKTSDNANDRTFFSNGAAGGTTVWNNDSDKKLKDNISTIPDALGKVLQLRGVNFEWKDKREPGQRMGLIAQEVAAVVPEVVTMSETASLQYGPLVALLIEAIKDQQVQIDELKKKI